METTTETRGPSNHADADREYKAGVRTVWAMGDYHAFAKELVWELGDVLVQQAGVRSGQRVLDVATGTGNVALRAAQAGARVVGSDLTPEHFVAARRNARELGVEVDWVEADAECLPFSDGEFDVVTSAVGAIFAPKHQRVADEMVRVCKPGGKIVMLNFTPEGLAGEFFAVFAPFMPPPRDGDQAPVSWGSEAHLRALFADRVVLETRRGSYVERAANPRAYCEFFKRTFGPAVAICRSLAAEPERLAQFDREFLAFAQKNDSSKGGVASEYRYEYLVVNAEKVR